MCALGVGISAIILLVLCRDANLIRLNKHSCRCTNTMSARRKLCNARLTISARETHAESQLSCQQQPEEKTLCSRAASLRRCCSLLMPACMLMVFMHFYFVHPCNYHDAVERSLQGRLYDLSLMSCIIYCLLKHELKRCICACIESECFA
jgi:hypothetical protein